MCKSVFSPRPRAHSSEPNTQATMKRCVCVSVKKTKNQANLPRLLRLVSLRNPPTGLGPIAPIWVRVIYASTRRDARTDSYGTERTLSVCHQDDLRQIERHPPGCYHLPPVETGIMAWIFRKIISCHSTCRMPLSSIAVIHCRPPSPCLPRMHLCRYQIGERVDR